LVLEQAFVGIFGVKITANLDCDRNNANEKMVENLGQKPRRKSG
jgi:hypothetical protein